MSPSEFSELTPRETYMYIDAAVERSNTQYRLAISTAWHTEAFARTKRLEPLSTIFEGMRTTPLTQEEKEARIDAMKDDAREWAKRHNERLSRDAGEAVP